MSIAAPVCGGPWVIESPLFFCGGITDEQEQEADWHALLVPRDTLIALRVRGKSVAQIAEHFEVSNQQCEWRLNAIL